MTDITRDPRLQPAAGHFLTYARLKAEYDKARNSEHNKNIHREVCLIQAMDHAKAKGFAAKPKHVRMSTMVKLLRAIEKESEL